MRTRRIALLCLLVVLALAITWIATQYRRDVRAALAGVSTGSHLLETPCGPIEYAMTGTGPPVLIVHGAGGGFDQGLQLAEEFIRPGFTVIAPSRFGYLGTPVPADASPQAQADAHACLLDALHFPQVVAAGFSAGAPSVMQLCLRHPDRCSAMVLVVPLAFAPRAEARSAPQPSRFAVNVIETTLGSDFVFWLATRLARDTMIETILGTPLADFKAASSPDQHRVLEVLRKIEPISRRAAGLRNDAAVAASLRPYELERLTLPTLIVTTENDGYGTSAGSRYTARRMPQARLVMFRDGGHMILGHQEEVSSALREFLAMTSSD